MRIPKLFLFLVVIGTLAIKSADADADAKKVGTSVLMFNEHPADHYDFFKMRNS